MKISIRPNPGQQGSALLVTLALCTILFMTIAGYLMTARHQVQMGHRSQVWNMSMAVAEAGIEEGLQHINVNSPNFTTGGWTQDGSTYKRTQKISDDAWYVVTIEAFDVNNPAITSIGYHNAPLLAQSGQGPMLAAAGVTTEGSAEQSTRTISRTIRVTATKNAGLFIGSLIARDGVDMNGNGVLTDSFISNDPNYSDNGFYPAGDSSKLLSNGDVYVNSSLINAANVGNADIYGHLVVGPNGAPSLGPNGGVGSYEWRAAGNNGIEPGYFRDDSNFTFPDVELPYTFGTTPTSGTISVTNITSVSSGTVTSTTYPSGVPPEDVVESISYATTSVEPSPVPDGMAVNLVTSSTRSKTYPAAGTFDPLVGVNKQGAWYYYDSITGHTYTYPITTYSYNSYVTNYSVTSETYDYILEGGDPDLSPVAFYVDEIDGNVFVTGNARLVARDGFDGEIFINSDGKLEMFAGGNSINLAGNGVINQNGYAANCMIWCLPSVTDIAFSGNAEITAVLYAPNADLKLNGGGNNSMDFIGSIIVNSATLNGHFSFHYDEALRSQTSNARYLVTSWEEL